jgi:hypothetical protein
VPRHKVARLFLAPDAFPQADTMLIRVGKTMLHEQAMTSREKFMDLTLEAVHPDLA